jgi:hypothetical protein
MFGTALSIVTLQDLSGVPAIHAARFGTDGASALRDKRRRRSSDPLGLSTIDISAAGAA